MNRLTRSAGLHGNKVMYIVGENAKHQHNGEEKFDGIAIVNKLGEFEDFMEQQGFESLEDLKSKLNKKFHIYDDEVRQGKVFNGVFFSYEQLMVMDQWTEFNTDYFKKYLDSQKENQALKDRWNKLKERVDKELQKDIKRSGLKHESFVICEQFVLDEMEELERGEDAR